MVAIGDRHLLVESINTCLLGALLHGPVDVIMEPTFGAHRTLTGNEELKEPVASCLITTRIASPGSRIAR